MDVDSPALRDAAVATEQAVEATMPINGIMAPLTEASTEAERLRGAGDASPVVPEWWPDSSASQLLTQGDWMDLAAAELACHGAEAPEERSTSSVERLRGAGDVDMAADGGVSQVAHPAPAAEAGSAEEHSGKHDAAAASGRESASSLAPIAATNGGEGSAADAARAAREAEEADEQADNAAIAALGKAADDPEVMSAQRDWLAHPELCVPEIIVYDAAHDPGLAWARRMAALRCAALLKAGPYR
jgi:hypothetical protein